MLKCQTSKKTYLTNELLTDEEFLTIKDVFEHHWLLEHTHDVPEMIYVLSGKGTQHIDGITIAANEGGHLSRLFHEHFKMSFNRYQQEYRL
jgi:mannose-6-phosphate isomerase-like protein (cupin superfamily)